MRERLDIPRFWWRGAEHTRPPEAVEAHAAASRSASGRRSSPAPDAAVAVPEEMIAEPRAMRRAKRRSTARRGALAACVVLVGVAAFVAVSRGGLSFAASAPLSSHVDQLMISAGLGVDEIRISGQRYTLDNDIFAALALDNPTSLLRYSSDAARRRVEALPWVGRATVTRVLPDTVEVAITERTPIAVWLHSEVATLVDIEGRELARVAPSTLPTLPRISGAGAPEAVGGYLAALATAPMIERRVTVAERVGQRRWTLDLDNGSRILLPAEGEQAALARLLRLADATGVLARPTVVDLRLEERVAVAPRTNGTTSQASPPKGPALKSASAL